MPRQTRTNLVAFNIQCSILNGDKDSSQQQTTEPTAPNSQSSPTNYIMATSVSIPLTPDDDRSNESLIFETLRNSGAVKCLSFSAQPLLPDSALRPYITTRPNFTGACSMSVASSLLPHLQELCFDSLKISNWGKVLMEATRQNRKLEMHLNECEISESAASALRYALQTNRIKQLHLVDCSCSTEVIQEISSGLRNTKSLVTLYLRGLVSPGRPCPLPRLTQDICYMIRSNAALTDLGLDCTNLRDDDLSSIARAIEGHQTLMSLDVSTNGFFGAPSIKNVMSMTKLVPTLRTIDLGFCNLNSEALDILATCLLGNNTVQELILSGNVIDDTSAILFGTLLHENKVLKTLQVDACDLSSAGFTSIVAGLASNVALDKFVAVMNPRLDRSALKTYC